MRSSFLALLLLSILPALPGAAEAPGYRVAGIVRQGESWNYAIIETPDGTSRVCSPGDLLAGAGTIVAVTAQGIVVQQDGVARTLILEGGRYATSAPGALPGETMALSSTMLRSDLREKLAGILGQKRSRGAGPPAAGAAQELLGIPFQARITSINGSAVRDLDDVLAAVQTALDQGGLLRVFVTGIEGVSHLYVVLRDEEMPE